jgi:hypothetical protein
MNEKRFLSVITVAALVSAGAILAEREAYAQLSLQVCQNAQCGAAEGEVLLTAQAGDSHGSTVVFMEQAANTVTAVASCLLLIPATSCSALVHLGPGTHSIGAASEIAVGQGVSANPVTFTVLSQAVVQLHMEPRDVDGGLSLSSIIDAQPRIGVPTGNVTFFQDGTVVELGTASLSSRSLTINGVTRTFGIASLTVPVDGAGPHVFIAVYDGDANYLPGQGEVAGTITTAPAGGSPGPAGPAGPQGPQGLMGPIGPQGIAGLSVAGSSLPVGDPNCPFGGAMFTASNGTTYVCDGAPGATGPQGPIGQNGAQGPAGPQGATGPQGAQGTPGILGLPRGGFVMVAHGSPGPQPAASFTFLGTVRFRFDDEDELQHHLTSAATDTRWVDAYTFNGN